VGNNGIMPGKRRWLNILQQSLPVFILIEGSINYPKERIYGN
jgi:hypothetical protein